MNTPPAACSAEVASTLRSRATAEDGSAAKAGHLPRVKSLLWRLTLPLLAAAALTQAGCSYPKAIPTYEFLTDYDRMTDRFEPLLSLVHMPEGAELSGYDGVIIGQVAVGDAWVEEREKAQQYATYFRCLLQKRILDTQKFDPYYPATASGSPHLMRLHAKITRFDMGCGWKRWMSCSLPFFQGGASDIQVEGRITDSATGRLLMEFADRRRHLGNTPWGPTPKTFNSDFVMKLTLDQTAACLAKFIDEAYHGLPPEGESDDTAAADADEESARE